MDPMEQTKAQESSIDFAALVTHIPVGVCKILLDGTYRLLYGNPYFFYLIGYTPEQFVAEQNNEVMRMFTPEEQCFVQKTIRAQLEAEQPGFHIEHRLMRRTGELVWVLVAANFITQKEGLAAHCVVVDITDRKQMEERLRIDEERFRLALMQTESSIFDYDLTSKIMIHGEKSADHYGLAQVTYNVPESLVEQKVVHPHSTGVFLEMYQHIRDGFPTASCVIQARTTDGKYAWRKITLTAIFDNNGRPVRAVGVLEDIDKQRRREEKLRERSQRDALTGLYHKGVTESKIRKILSQGVVFGALYILDLDAFKQVNDTYGHIFGDMVLKETARRISALCRREDIVGRIGGDEFLLYLQHVSDRQTAKRKAEELCAAFAQPFTLEGIRAQVTCTVGLALCPADGNEFLRLCQKADIALYEAKRQGKNRACLYDASMGESVGKFIYSNSPIDSPLTEEDEEPLG